MNNHSLSNLILRITLGISFFFHGVNRIVNGVANFSSGMVDKFQDSFLPEWTVSAFSYGLPFAELLLGLLLLIGFKLKEVLLASFILMAFLIAGVCIIGQWGALSIQFLHVLLIYLLVKNLPAKDVE
ncbi:MAG: MauE/DoxX family redox-associated membrane protein [Candidatus Cyclobacteriaceae bacterium M2_1C_046]